MEFSTHDYVECRLDADQPRQPLRSPRARDDAQRDFGQAQARTGRREPHVAGQRQLQATAGGDGVDGGNDRFRRSLDLIEDGGKVRGIRRRGIVELPYVGAAAEHPSGTRNDDGADRVVGQHGGDALAEQPPHGPAETIDGRVVETEDGDVAVMFDVDGPGHD